MASSKVGANHKDKLDAISRGERVPCKDGRCTGIIGVDGYCNSCKKSLDWQEDDLGEIDKFNIILKAAKKEGMEVDDFLIKIGLSKDQKSAFLKRICELCGNNSVHNKDFQPNLNLIKLKHHLGFKRLSFFIPFIVLITMFATLMFNEQNISEDEGFIAFPIVSGLVALVSYIMVRIVYWVVDGFRKARID